MRLGQWWINARAIFSGKVVGVAVEPAQDCMRCIKHRHVQNCHRAARPRWLELFPENVRLRDGNGHVIKSAGINGDLDFVLPYLILL